MRTVKRTSLPPNAQKQLALKTLCQAYAREKRYWLRYFQPWNRQAFLNKPRLIRNEKIKQKYTTSLQGRHWKLALDDAAETWDRYWQAIFVKVRSKISRRKLSDIDRHYAFWLLKGYSQFAELMQGKLPEPPFQIEKKRGIANYVRRLVRLNKGKPPTVKLARSVRFDANCYETFQLKKRQYIKLMSLEPGKRIILPLSGKTLISGTITLVMSQEKTELHIPQELKKKSYCKGKLEAVDFGYTEVMTDTEGCTYGAQFGKHLNEASEYRHQKMQKRHKLHALEKNGSKKARSLRKYNLGKIKQCSKNHCFKETLENTINYAINQLIRTKQPSVLVTEDLRHIFKYNKPKQVNRRLSSWLRGRLQDRIAFKALAEGFCHQQVNPAYGSQSCPHCEFVDQKNRNKDCFQCLHCGHEGSSDRVAALNYARRVGDHEIGQYTPYCQVKTILLARFHRRLESGQPETVPGKTRYRIRDESTISIETHFHSQERDFPRKNWTVTQRAKQK